MALHMQQVEQLMQEQEQAAQLAGRAYVDDPVWGRWVRGGERAHACSVCVCVNSLLPLLHAL